MAVALAVAAAWQLSQWHEHRRVRTLEEQNRSSLRGPQGAEKQSIWSSCHSHRPVTQMPVDSGKPALQVGYLRLLICTASEHGLLAGQFLVLSGHN